jgi:hypothetical protein
MPRLVQRIPTRRVFDEDFDYNPSPPRRGVVHSQSGQHQQPSRPLSETLGTITETFAYSLTNGMNSANRALKTIFIAVALGSFVLGMLLMRTIDREILGAASENQKPSVSSAEK